MPQKYMPDASDLRRTVLSQVITKSYVETLTSRYSLRPPTQIRTFGSDKQYLATITRTNYLGTSSYVKKEISLLSNLFHFK